MFRPRLLYSSSVTRDNVFSAPAQEEHQSEHSVSNQHATKSPKRVLCFRPTSINLNHRPGEIKYYPGMRLPQPLQEHESCHQRHRDTLIQTTKRRQSSIHSRLLCLPAERNLRSRHWFHGDICTSLQLPSRDGLPPNSVETPARRRHQEPKRA